MNWELQIHPPVELDPSSLPLEFAVSVTRLETGIY